MDVFDISRFLMAGDAPAGEWTILSFIEDVTDLLVEWGEILYAILGLIMLGFGIYKIARALSSNGRGQVNWVLNIALIFFGAALITVGVSNTLQNFGNGMREELENLPNAQAVDPGLTPALPAAIAISPSGIYIE